MIYKIVRPIISLFIKIYRPVIIGKENILKNERLILAGNHTSYVDPLLVMSSTKRCIHFFAKDDLDKGLKKYIFRAMKIIPVNRKIKDRNCINKGIDVLNNNEVIGIFPEGTINKTKDIIMPFKYGAVKMAYETNSKIVPFSIVNKFTPFKKSVVIIFDKPISISSDLEKENNKLMEIIKKNIRGVK